ncbi:MAG: cellobiose phosphorylase [Clostridia bacterium]|nr:cellobiose phosphorylase [Clostridia bacterium]
MAAWQFTDDQGAFVLPQPENNSELYFPLCSESGVLSSITPTLGGDCKTDQNGFLLSPVSACNLHNDKSTRALWVFADGESWAATGGSARQEYERMSGHAERSTLEAGILYHRITRESGVLPLRAQILSFAPVDDPAELTVVTLTNTGDAPLTFTATAAIPLYARSADNIRDHRHVTSLLHRIHVLPNGVAVIPTMNFDERGHRFNHRAYAAFAACGEGEIAGFFPTAASLTGEGGSYAAPEAVLRNLPPCAQAGDVSAGEEACCGIRFGAITLGPGASAEFRLALCFAADTDDLPALGRRLTDARYIADAFAAMQRHWQGPLTFTSGDRRFDRWMRWVSFQPVLRRLYGCSFLPHHDYGRGGRGWRDLWQDCLSLLLTEPDSVRSLLLNNFGGVRIDGTNATILGAHPGEFVADRNNIPRVWMDHGAWPLETTRFYIDQSGDFAFLLEKQTYFRDALCDRGRGRDQSWTEGESLLPTRAGSPYRGSVLEHLLLQQLTAAMDVGEHGMLLLRGADWNDALDMAGNRGESVAFSAFYAGNLEQLCALLRGLAARESISSVPLLCEIDPLLEAARTGSPESKALDAYCALCRGGVSGETRSYPVDDLIEALHALSGRLSERIRTQEWIDIDNSTGHFNSYYDDHGRAVEGGHPLGYRMMLTGQVFAIMSGVADDTQIPRIIRACDAYLYAPELGGYRLNTDFGELKPDLGRQFGFAYGTKENGAVFSHMSTMYAAALYRRGYACAGYQALSALYRQACRFETSRIYPGIPEYFDGRGRGAYHYLTGAASWYTMTALCWMYGVRGCEGDLLLAPQLLPGQFGDGYAGVGTLFAGRRLLIRYHNPANLGPDSYCLRFVRLDGRPLDCGARIPRSMLLALSADTEHLIEAELG